MSPGCGGCARDVREAPFAGAQHTDQEYRAPPLRHPLTSRTVACGHVEEEGVSRFCRHSYSHCLQPSPPRTIASAELGVRRVVMMYTVREQVQPLAEREW